MAGAAVGKNSGPNTNEAAVALFLNGRIGFREIAAIVTEALEELGDAAGTSLNELLDADTAAREFVRTQAKR